MRVQFFCRVILLLLVSQSGISQTINQEDFINQLKQTHPLFEQEKLTAQIENEERNSLLGAQDWDLFFSVDYSHEKPAIAFSGPDRTDAFSVSSGIERRFWKTGGKLTVSFSSGYANININPLFGFPNDFYQNRFAITYIHPLKRNKNGFLDRLQYDLKQFDIDFSEVRALENIEGFLANAAAKFLDWVFLGEQKNIVIDRLKLSEEELSRIKRRREANLVDQADVIRAEDAVRIWRQNQVLVESMWKVLQAELAVLTQDNKLYTLSPEFNLYKIEILIPLEDAVLQLKEHSRLLKILKVRLQQLDYTRKGYRETLKPDLSIIAQFNTKSFDESLGKSLSMNKPDAVLGLQLSFPLENRTAKAKVTKTDLQIAQFKSQIENLTLTLTSTLSNLHIRIKEMENVLTLNLEQIRSAEERTVEELKLYNQGRGELTFVIQSRDNEQNAKLTYAQNALTYHKLKISYSALMDQLYE